MAYLKPPWFVVNVFNKLAMTFGISGSLTLVVAKRKTGEPQRIPVIIVPHNGGRYLVSARGESEWVRNLRASGHAELVGQGTSEAFNAIEVPVAERTPMIEGFRKAAGKMVEDYFKTLPGPEDHPVFRIEKR